MTDLATLAISLLALFCTLLWYRENKRQARETADDLAEDKVASGKPLSAAYRAGYERDKNRNWVSGLYFGQRNMTVAKKVIDAGDELDDKLKVEAQQKQRSYCDAETQTIETTPAKPAAQCDESKPYCLACLRRGEECVYVAAPSSRQSSRSPAPSQPHKPTPGRRRDVSPILSSFEGDGYSPGPSPEPSPGQNQGQLAGDLSYDTRHMLDLRLMHHYCLRTTHFFARTFPDSVRVAFQTHIPQLAFQHGFLMDAILLVSMIHMRCTDGSPPELSDPLPIYAYRDQALRSLRAAVMNVSPHNVHAVLGASVLHTTVSFAMDRITQQPGLWVSNWLTLVLGQRQFRSAEYGYLERLANLAPDMPTDSHSPGLYGSFADLPAATQETVPVDIERALAREEQANGHRTSSTSIDILRMAASGIGRLIAIIREPCHYEEENAWLEKKIKAWAFDVVPSEFGELVRQCEPIALIIIAYYLALFPFLPDTWPSQGVARHDLDEIRSMIHPAWTAYLAVPERALQAPDAASLAQVLLSSLPNK